MSDRDAQTLTGGLEETTDSTGTLTGGLEDTESSVVSSQSAVDLGLHPNIVQCWDVRELGGIPRVFMDYLSGGSLKDWIAQGKVQPGEWDTILSARKGCRS